MLRRVLIVEDEYELSLNLEEQLVNLGFSVPVICSNARETLAYLENNVVDLLLIDIMIIGEMDGIELASLVKKKWNKPVVFSTAYAENELFLKALKVNPAGYLVKPYKMDDLKTTLMLAFSKIDLMEGSDFSKETTFLKVRDKGFLIFLHPEEILLAEADGLYTKIFTHNKKYIMRDILKDVEKKLPSRLFLRVHKSFLVNKNKIHSFNGRSVVIGNYTVPIRRGLYKHLQDVVTNKLDNRYTT
jgi:DNA-binding LytR/AlgR family response regulator